MSMQDVARDTNGAAERRQRERAGREDVQGTGRGANLRLVWDQAESVADLERSRDGLMLCVGVTPGEDGEPDLLWVHTMQGELLLAAEGNEIHRAWSCFAPLQTLTEMQVAQFLSGFEALTAKLFAASERPAEVRSTTPVRVSTAEIQALMNVREAAA